VGRYGWVDTGKKTHTKGGKAEKGGRDESKGHYVRGGRKQKGGPRRKEGLKEVHKKKGGPC